MFEGKEISKTLPFKGGQVDYGLDVKPEGAVDGEAMVAVDRKFWADIVSVKLSLATIVTVDGKAAVNKLLGGSTNFIAKVIVSAVNGLQKETPKV